MTDKNFVLAITGPAGSGKSTVAEKLARQLKQCVNIDADHVKHFIVSGFIYDDSPAGRQQWKLLGDDMGLLAHNFHKEGYNIIINGYINEPAWENIQKHVTIDYKVLLLPKVEASTERDKLRHEDYRMGAAAVSEHHDYFSESNYYSDFVRVDSTDLSVDATVSRLMEIIAR